MSMSPIHCFAFFMIKRAFMIWGWWGSLFLPKIKAPDRRSTSSNSWNITSTYSFESKKCEKEWESHLFSFSWIGMRYSLESSFCCCCICRGDTHDVFQSFNIQTLPQILKNASTLTQTIKSSKSTVLNTISPLPKAIVFPLSTNLSTATIAASLLVYELRFWIKGGLQVRHVSSGGRAMDGEGSSLSWTAAKLTRCESRLSETKTVESKWIWHNRRHWSQHKSSFALLWNSPIKTFVNWLIIM